MHQSGRVVRVNGGVATVRFMRSKACEHCGACIYIGDTEAEVEIKNTLEALPGDMVRVELQAKSFLQANLLAYVLPLCLLIAGVALGSRISDVWGVVLGLVGAGSCFFILRALEPRLKKSNRFHPRMVSVEEYRDNIEIEGEKENG